MGGRAASEPETLHELLADEGIELHEIPRPGGKDHGGPRSKLVCPQCGGGKAREQNFFVKIDPDGKGFRYVCHRQNHCGVQGGRRLLGAGMVGATAWEPKVYRRPHPPEEIHRPDTLLTYFAKFGISADTIEAFGVHRSTRSMPVLDKAGKQIAGEWRERAVIAYPYREDGALLNVKYKAVYSGGAKRFMQEPEAEPSLYNIDAFLSDEAGYFVEGEDDALAMAECGFRQVTTVVDGAPSKLATTYDPLADEDGRYVALVGHAKIAGLKRIILAGDMDAAGQIHHEEIARRVGKARCWVVRWPEGCKDAKDTLTKRGRDAVRFAIANADPYPLEGVEVVTDETIIKLWKGIEQARYITGLPAIDQRISLRDEGSFIVTTGIPGHGKSAAWNALATMYTEYREEQAISNLALRPFHTVVFGAEMSNARLAVDLISQRAKKPFFPHPIVPRLSEEEATDLNRGWVRKHFSFIHWPDRSTQPPVSWIKTRTRELVIRTGAKLVIWDPWQEIDDEMPQTWRRPHSDWVGVVLQGMIGLSVELRINLVLITHPSKPRERNKDGSYPIPGGYDIGGSQNFYSRCDAGLTVHRPDFSGSQMLVRCWKTKDKRFAQTGDTTLRFEPTTTRLFPVPVEVDALGEPTTHWQDQSDG